MRIFEKLLLLPFIDALALAGIAYVTVADYAVPVLFLVLAIEAVTEMLFLAGNGLRREKTPPGKPSRGKICFRPFGNALLLGTVAGGLMLYIEFQDYHRGEYFLAGTGNLDWLYTAEMFLIPTAIVFVVVAVVEVAVAVLVRKILKTPSAVPPAAP